MKRGGGGERNRRKKKRKKEKKKRKTNLSEVSLSLLDRHTTESHDGLTSVLVVNTEVSAASLAA